MDRTAAEDVTPSPELKGATESPRVPDTNLGRAPIMSVGTSMQSEDGFHFLQQGNVQSFNALRENPMWRPNFAGRDLRGLNLSGMNFNRANLAGADLRGVNLAYADLWLANLEGAQMNNANLQGANLLHANLTKAQLQGANVQTNLTNTKLLGALFDKKTALPHPEDFLSAQLVTISAHREVTIELPPTLPVEYIQSLEAILSHNRPSERFKPYGQETQPTE